jgi:crossover junction endodeoxyribonuclease RuvC
MRILGIDPGLATTGWAVVDFEGRSAPHVVDFGVVSTEKTATHESRLEEIYTDLAQLIEKFKPEQGALERLLFNTNVKTAMNVGEARGVVILAMQQEELPISQFTPPQIKSSVAGNGRADKKQVQENVKRLCGLKLLPKPDDAADAIAVAICCYDSLKTARMVKE